MAAFDHTLCLLQNDAGDLDMTVGRLVEGRCDHFGIDAAHHVGDFLGTLVDEEYHDISLGVIFGDSVGNILKKNSLAGLGRRHDQTTLPLADRREHVDYAGREIGRRAACQIELFVGEKGCQVLERHTVADKVERTAVDSLNRRKREILFTLAWGTHYSLYDIPCLEAVLLDLLLSQINVVGRRHIIEISRAQEPEALVVDLEHSGCLDKILEIVTGQLRELDAVLIVLLILVVSVLFLFSLPLLIVERLLAIGGRLTDHNRSGDHRLLGSLLCLTLGFLSLSLRPRNKFLTAATGKKLSEGGVFRAKIHLTLNTLFFSDRRMMLLRCLFRLSVFTVLRLGNFGSIGLYGLGGDRFGLFNYGFGHLCHLGRGLSGGDVDLAGTSATLLLWGGCLYRFSLYGRLIFGGRLFSHLGCNRSLLGRSLLHRLILSLATAFFWCRRRFFRILFILIVISFACRTATL